MYLTQALFQGLRYLTVILKQFTGRETDSRYELHMEE